MFDGAALDFVVDYANYVFVPALTLALSGLLTEPWATAAGIVVAVVGALYFADRRMKTPTRASADFRPSGTWSSSSSWSTGCRNGRRW